MDHLELAVDSDSAEQREEHAIVARWIKHFLTSVVDGIHTLDEMERAPKTDPETLVADSMPFDSDGVAEEPIQ